MTHTISRPVAPGRRKKLWTLEHRLDGDTHRCVRRLLLQSCRARLRDG